MSLWFKTLQAKASSCVYHLLVVIRPTGEGTDGSLDTNTNTQQIQKITRLHHGTMDTTRWSLCKRN